MIAAIFYVEIEETILLGGLKSVEQNRSVFQFWDIILRKIEYIIKSIKPILMKAFFIKLACFAVFYLVVSCSVSQDYYEEDSEDYTYQEDNFVKKPGGCYAKTLIGDQFDYWEESYPIYLGNANDNFDYLKEKKLLLAEKSTKWVKRKADRNCLSADPNDCLVWCQVEIPEKIEVITIVTDTTQTNNYEWEKFKLSKMVKKGGFTEWREVVCNYKVTADLNQQIQRALRDKGYDSGPIDNIIGTKTKAALVAFQKKNNLPIGNLNIETMYALGIDY